MSDMDKAMDLIRDELAKAGDNPGLAVLGEYLTHRLRTDPGIAAAVLKCKQPVKDGFEAIRSHARKIAKGGCAVVDDKTGFGIACRHWGIPEDGAENPAPAADAQALAQTNPSAAFGGTSPHRGGMDALDLDALLGV